MSFIKFVQKVLDEGDKKKSKDDILRFQYGCAMIYFDLPEIKQIHSKIKDEELYKTREEGYGMECDPHVTLLFGLHSDEVEDDTIMDICGRRGYKDVILKNISLFKNKEFDVIKFDAEGEDLYYINSLLVKYPHTTDYPDYHPHCTIAYVKAGMGEEVLKRIKGDIELEIVPKEVVYSKPDRSKVTKALTDYDNLSV